MKNFSVQVSIMCVCVFIRVCLYLSLPFCTPRVDLSGPGELLPRLVPVERMLFCRAQKEAISIKHGYVIFASVTIVNMNGALTNGGRGRGFLSVGCSKWAWRNFS